jgi:tRNA (guanine-N7-)-methyltransferase
MSGPDSTGQQGARNRPVRSYVIRGGRLTTGQARALEALWPRHGIDSQAGDSALDYEALFGRRAPVIVEIGFGNGEATWRTAQAYPEQDFIGVEVHRPGVGRLLMALAEHELHNVRIACMDAVEFMDERIPPASLCGVRIYFPDPWPKKRHHKRRLVQPPFVAGLASRMAPGAILHIATDWAPYAEYISEVLAVSEDFRNLAESGDYSARPAWRPGTRYERRGRNLGHRVYDLVYGRV